MSPLAESGLSHEAFAHLASAFGRAAARRLSVFWLSLVEDGTDGARAQYGRATFYRNLAQITELGLSWADANTRAAAILQAGDETIYRRYTTQRYVAECLISAPTPYPDQLRSRKFSNPIFMTPPGYLNAFPEADDYLFTTSEKAWKAISTFGLKAHDNLWRVSLTTLQDQLKSKRYRRWLKEVKPLRGDYTEPRRTLEDRAAIFNDEGIAGLKARYTDSHAYHSQRLIVESGLVRKPTEEGLNNQHGEKDANH